VGITAALRLRGVDAARAPASSSSSGSSRRGAVFLLGAGPGVADDAAARLRGRHPAARHRRDMGGRDAGATDDEESCAGSRVRATVVLVAYGAPGQVAWIERNRLRLEGPEFGSRPASAAR
jgi:N-acetylglucosaminyldiphosphoundecaprenol N-acetyl-beta-D-mannosaminyltransferase